MPTTHKPIKTIPQYLSWLEMVDKEFSRREREELTFFYRGHSDQAYKIVPSAYREADGKSYRGIEYDIYNELILREPAEFSTDNSIFERLVRMQHHGLYTRLLDLTYNPLVALYFACEAKKVGRIEKNGEILLFICPKKSVRFPTAIPPESLIGLEKKLPHKDIWEGSPFDTKSSIEVGVAGMVADKLNRWLGYLKYSPYMQMAGGICARIIDEFSTTSSETLSDCLTLTDTTTIAEKIHHIEETDAPEFFRKCETQINTGHPTSGLSPTEIYGLVHSNELTTNPAIAPLRQLDRLKKEHRANIENIQASVCSDLAIPYNSACTRLSTFLRGFTYHYFVNPPINNERIRRQQGAFIIFPPVQTASSEDRINDRPIKRVTIDARSKSKLLNDLNVLGISKSTLLPSLNEQAAAVLKRYPPKPYR